MIWFDNQMLLVAIWHYILFQPLSPSYEKYLEIIDVIIRYQLSLENRALLSKIDLPPSPTHLV